MNRIIVFFSYLIIVFIALNCSNIKISHKEPSVGGVGIQFQVPFWEPQKIDSILEDFKKEYQKTKFAWKFDTNLSIICKGKIEDYFSQAKETLEFEKFSINKAFNLRKIEAQRKLLAQYYINDYDISIIIECLETRFRIQNTFIIIIKYHLCSDRVVMDDKAKQYSISLIDKLCKECSREVATSFGFVRTSRTPQTNDEKIIFEKFGEKGLIAIDLINGINSFEIIMKESGLSNQEINELINYLIENNFVKFK